MAIRFVKEHFPTANVTWTRGPSYNGKPDGQLVLTDATSGQRVASVTQREVSEEFYGAGAEALKAAIAKYRQSMR